MKNIKKAVCAIAIVCVTLLPALASAETIKVGVMTWPGMKTIGLITEQVLKDSGIDVKSVEFSNWGIAFAALRKGDVQILETQVDYVTQDYWDKYKSRLEKISPVSYGLYQAVAVPKYVDIDSMTQLNENADKFHGKIIGIEEGSGLMREAEQAMKVYGLDKLKLIPGSTPAMTAALKSAVARKQWIAVTLWDPTWMFMKYDMKFLKDPKHVFSPPQSYSWIGRKGFSEKHPHAREVLASIFISIDDNRKMMAAIEDGKTMDQAVSDWMKTNADKIKRWENIKSYPEKK